MPNEKPLLRYALLQELLPLLAEFEAARPDAPGPDALRAFLDWLPTQAQAAPGAPTYASARMAPNPYETPESLLGKLVTFMYRYVRGYIRLALADTPLVTFDDFTYLITLFTEGSFSKSELIARNIQEKATGTEVIRRLLKQQLVSEGPHASDRRRKVLQISPAGQALLLRVLPRMGQVAQLSAGNLSPAELTQLVQLLHKLDAFHHPIFAGSKADSFDGFMAKHLAERSQLWEPGQA
ncbi:hypothetical protein [Hymenobacter sp.]|uniref:MarR family winged helix-turn-helix transcriptional regulator n=1 Tax=Hymenobacter sp. TaxID=1898978 RepID=UPI00286A6E8D|nr:hypothetical protein [Hymenobacter sp.]